MSDVVAAAGIVLAAALSAGGGLTLLIKNRSTRPSGWQVAVNGLTKQVDDLTKRVETAENRARAAEARAEEVVAENQLHQATIARQTRSMDAKDGRIVQLLTAWPPTSRPPVPNPAHEPYL